MSMASGTRESAGQSAPMFRAVTLRPSPEHRLTLPVRGRLLHIIDRQPSEGSISLLLGPVGSGKTVLALQWVQQHGTDVQYISARPADDIPTDWIHEPSAVGQRIADGMNACAVNVREPSLDHLREQLATIATLLQETGERFVMDDADLLSTEGTKLLQPFLAEQMRHAHIDQAMVISRFIDTGSVGGLHAFARMRVLLPTTIAFTADETAAAHAAGVFGDATLPEALGARDDANGWILGMLATLGGHGGGTIDGIAFQGQILNDMLMLQPMPILWVLVISALVPRLSFDLLERLVERVGAPAWVTSTFTSWLPITEFDEQDGTFQIAPPMRTVLRRMREMTTRDETATDLLDIAIGHYVAEGDLASATKLAVDRGMGRHFLSHLKPMCQAYADVENWQAIGDVVRLLPEDVLVQDPDLVFWHFHGLVEDDHWADMNRLLELVSQAWENSDDPLNRARLLLIRALNHHVMGRAREAVDQAVASYNMFPASYPRERLWTAGTVSMAASYAGDLAVARQWSAIANLEATHLGSSSRWWHNNAGLLILSWLAVCGHMEEAYEAASRQVRTLAADDPPSTTQYLLLMAQIDAERLRFDSALELLERAVESADDHSTHAHHIRMTRSNLARALGDPEEAWDILSFSGDSGQLRYDFFRRELTSRARIAVDLGDIEAAQLMIDSAPTLAQTWPEWFGDAHPGLTIGILHELEGDHDTALSLVTSVLTESQRRNHTYNIVRAYAVQAWMLHHMNAFDGRDHAIEQAVLAAGQSGYQLAFMAVGVDVRELRTVEAEQPLPVSAPATLPAARPGHHETLTRREIELLAMVARKMSNQDIATALFLSVSTVKNHLRNAFQKLGADNRRSAVRNARERGLIQD